MPGGREVEFPDWFAASSASELSQVSLKIIGLMTSFFFFLLERAKFPQMEPIS